MQEFATKLKEALDIPYSLLRLGDSDRLMCGKVWCHAWKVGQALGPFTKVEGLEGLVVLWSKCWAKLHHPAYSLAYTLMPEYHNVKDNPNPNPNGRISFLIQKLSRMWMT